MNTSTDGKMLREQIIALANAKTPQKTIATQLGCSITTVRRTMKAAGLAGQSKGARNFKIASHVFDLIDTPDKAYWLGFMLADGCIARSAGTNRTVRVSLQSRDESHLRKLANFLGFKGEFADDLREGHPRKVLAFNDVPLTKSLIAHGWLNYKSGVSFEIVDIIPDGLFNQRESRGGNADGTPTLPASTQALFTRLLVGLGQPRLRLNRGRRCSIFGGPIEPTCLDLVITSTIAVKPGWRGSTFAGWNSMEIARLFGITSMTSNSCLPAKSWQ
jgi:hypothetical protein